jgi:hypothetical protein
MDVFVYVVVLNLAIQYVPSVISETFTLSLLTAVLLKVALEAVLLLKSKILSRFRAATTRLGRWAAAALLWVAAAGSKIVVLEMVDLLFGDAVSLGNFISVTLLVLALLLSRAAVRRLLYGNGTDDSPDPELPVSARRGALLLRRHARMRVDGPVFETWKLGYLVDTIYLRDLWMHRIDLARAVDRPLELSADHDGRITAEVVAEWARRHGQPFFLELTGPAGGSYAHQPDAPEAEHLKLDAIEFCRTLGGRASATGLLATVVPF